MIFLLFLGFVICVLAYVFFIRSANKSVESLNVTKEEVTPAPVVEKVVVKEKKTRKPRVKKTETTEVAPVKKTRKPRSKKV